MLTEQLKKIVGDGGWTTDAHELEPHLVEWRDAWRGKTSIMVSPDTVEKVADVVRACRVAGTAIVPQGGNTGLCGGAIPDVDGSQVLLSLSRMNRIRAIDPEDHSIVAEAGCTLASIQAAACDVDRFFPLSLAAEGSCQIGGNLSTDAGGINVLRYGTARDQALGLEVVLADGSILNGLRNLRKDTAGYDLKHLFIGSEGTLGIITAASLKMHPVLEDVETAFLALESPAKAVELLSILRQQLADRIHAFELMPDRALRFVSRHMQDIRLPVAPEHPWYVLLEASGDSTGRMEAGLVNALERGILVEAITAKNERESAGFWRLRHAISEAQKREGASLKHDISVPVGSVADFIEVASAAVTNYLPGLRVVAFGHAGDGNVHFNLSQPKDAEPADFLGHRDALADVVYDVVDRFGGSISAEHGIGVAKRSHLEAYKSETEIMLMRTLKSALDPEGLLNPGKVV